MIFVTSRLLFWHVALTSLIKQNVSKDCSFIFNCCFHSVLWQHSSEEIYSYKYKLISYSLRSPRIFQFSCQGNHRIFLLSKHSIKCCLFQSSSLFPQFGVLSIHPSAKSYTTICTVIKNNSVLLTCLSPQCCS